jgi:hypothetical protein
MNEQTPHNKSYTLADIEAYLLGRLSPAEMHAMEKAALHDPLLADAIEGYRGSHLFAAKKHLQEIEQQILQQNTRQAPVITGRFPAKRWWRIAAMVIALAGIGGIGLLVMNTSVQKREVAKQDMPAIQKDTLPVVAATTTDSSQAKPATVSSKPRKRKKTADTTHALTSEPIADAASLVVAAPKAAIKTDTIVYNPFNYSVASLPLAIPGRAAGVSVTRQSPVLMRSKSIVNSDTAKHTGLTETMVLGHAYQNRKIPDDDAHRPTAPIDSLNLCPDGGWDFFNKYLQSRLGSDTHGEAVADLVLDVTGRVKEVTIVHAFNRNLDAFSRAVNRQIKTMLLEGPLWLVNNVKKEGNYRLYIEF